MGIFRLEENVPSIYPSESRDFQLFCRLFDVIQNGVKNDIDSLEFASNGMLVRSNMLPLAKTGVGFFSNSVTDSYALRYLIVAFPYIIKYKGTERGIREAVRVFLKGIHVDQSVSVKIQGKGDNSGNQEISDHFVEIGLQVPVKDMLALQDILSYVIPVGYAIKFTFMADRKYSDEYQMSDSIKYLYVSDNINSQVKASTGKYYNYSADRDILGSSTDPWNTYGCHYSDKQGMPFKTFSKVGTTGAISHEDASFTSGRTVLSEERVIENAEE